MTEAINAIVQYAFMDLDLSRIESACLADNKPSRGVLEKCGFKYEGVAQAYIQINGRWRTHVLYSALRYDRRGKTSAGICLLYTSPSPRDRQKSRMPSSA